jgi:hypothetical protein
MAFALTGAAATYTPSSASDGFSDNSNPYAVIVDRNVFRLNPPPPPPSDADKKARDLPKVYLDGIIRIGDDVRVLFSIPPKDAKGATSYFKLAPGERDDVLELVKIHPNQQEVDILVNGTAETLSVLSNSLAVSDGKAAGGGSGPEPPPAVLRGKRRGMDSPDASSPNRDSSPYGGVKVSGGGGGGGAATTIGGGGSSFGGGGTMVGGGGSSFGGGGASPSSYGGGGGVSVSGGGSSSLGSQIANNLFSGSSASLPANVPTTPTLEPEEQIQKLNEQSVALGLGPLPAPPAPRQPRQ